MSLKTYTATSVTITVGVSCLHCRKPAHGLYCLVFDNQGRIVGCCDCLPDTFAGIGHLHTEENRTHHVVSEQTVNDFPIKFGKGKP